MLPDYSIVIATRSRHLDLMRTLESLKAQTLQPERVVVVDASPSNETRDLLEKNSFDRVVYLRADASSSALQRNQGAREVRTPLISFLDDDVWLPPDLYEKLLSVLATDAEGRIGGVAGRIRGLEHSKPGRLLRWYYQIQAGYRHPHYGGRLFGPAINCLPCYAEEKGPLIEAEWLNSTCVLYRRELFEKQQFPQFEGYSFMEDAHLSARIAKTHRLYFHADAFYEHFSPESSAKSDKRALARMRLHNQKIIAREVMGLGRVETQAKLLLHRLFTSFVIIRERNPGWARELEGTWSC
ncbi:MAG: glycosyltransferase family 2 protein [Methylacidiphilales bacterium]|nr:glycosyltransferase family 2 protein [Candidatus Methylacidiphilales bacterium]